MNWGKGLALAMAGFMTFILYMVFTLMSKNTDLESEDYYQKEIEFEKEIQAISNTNELKEKVNVSKNDDFVIVKFPSLENMDSIQVYMFRPNDERDDQIFSIEDSKTLMIPLRKLTTGIYDMKIQFKIDGKLFMQKESIRISRTFNNQNI